MSKRKTYNHASQQKGWTDSSPDVGFSKGQLQDENYDQTLAIHDPLWRYIITHYPKESLSPVVTLDYNTIPIAIELSQWTYPVTSVIRTYADLEKVKRDGEIHAGNFRNLYYCDYLKTIPRCRTVVLLNRLTYLSTSDMFSFLDMALRRSSEVLASEKYTKDWLNVLKSRYDVKMVVYEEGLWCLLTIKTLQD